MASQQNLEFGPVPEGWYSINLTLNPNRKVGSNMSNGDIYSGEGIQTIPRGIKTLGGDWASYQNWGTKRARLDPYGNSDKFGRTNLYLHNSFKGFTHGCIESRTGVFDFLMKYRIDHSTIHLQVAYPSPSTITNGE